MKRIALIHTVGSVYASFETQLRSVLGEEVLIHNILDDFLATNPIEVGSFTKTNVERLRCDIQSAVLTGCDVVVTSCSTLSPAVERLKGEFSTPIITIDDAMANKAVEAGSSLVVLATAHSTVEPTLEKLRRTAKEQGKAISVEAFVCTEAITALRRGDKEEHDRLGLGVEPQGCSCRCLCACTGLHGTHGGANSSTAAYSCVLQSQAVYGAGGSVSEALGLRYYFRK